jgi:hypothetical protein
VRLLVCGSRFWTNRGHFGLVMRGFLDRYGSDFEIIEGCAGGADQMAEKFAEQFNIPVQHFPARWDDYGPAERWRAGHDRNRSMLEQGQPDMVVAFKSSLDPKLSKGGTENMVKIAREAGVRVMVVGDGADLLP